MTYKKEVEANVFEDRFAPTVHPDFPQLKHDCHYVAVRNQQLQRAGSIAEELARRELGGLVRGIRSKPTWSAHFSRLVSEFTERALANENKPTSAKAAL